MSYRAIILFLFSAFTANHCIAQQDTVDLLTKLQFDIDSIVNNAIQEKAFPGCIVYASLDGEPLINTTYGHHTYDSLRLVSATDLYDLASLTKVMGATLALMKLYEAGKLDLDAPLKDYVDGLGWRKIRNVTIRECLAHQAGLKSWIKYYEEIQKKDGSFKRKTIAKTQSVEYPYRIGERMYLHQNFYKKIKKLIKKAPLNREQGYVYSGLFYYLVPEIVENLSGEKYSIFLKRIYDQAGIDDLLFNPLDHYPQEKIVPTEIDSFFRYQPIHGMVHDEGAILMKGVSGNAGLFGDIESVAKLWEMFLSKGSVDSTQVVAPSTINLFTSYQYPSMNNRRGLGFDKPLLEYDPVISSIARSSSVWSFGHTGYTGTLVWADPKYDLLFVFLSNRVYPTREQKAIYQLNVRPEIHQRIYDYLEEIR